MGLNAKKNLRYLVLAIGHRYEMMKYLSIKILSLKKLEKKGKIL